MLFKSEDVEVSLETALATYLKQGGYDVYWQQTHETEPQTGEEQARATVTLVDEFPANPEYIVRLRNEGSGEEVVIPALSLQLVDEPKRIEIMGLGHKDYRWHRTVRIDGLASDKFQQQALADLLHDFFNEVECKPFDIFNYDGEATLIGQVEIEVAGVRRQVLYENPEAARFYLQATAVIAYVE